MASFDINAYKPKAQLSDSVGIFESIKSKKRVASKEYCQNSVCQDVLKGDLDAAATLKHPALQEILATIEPRSGHTFCVVSEVCDNGDLRQAIAGGDAFTGTERSIVLYGVAQGIKFLHDKHVVHSNLQPSNVLLDGNREPRVCEFGIHRNGASSEFCAPELFRKEREYGKAVDIYGLAMIMCLLWVDDVYFDEEIEARDMGQWVIEGERPILPGCIEDHVADLIEACWSGDPAARPTIERVIELLEDERYMFPGTDVEKFGAYK